MTALSGAYTKVGNANASEMQQTSHRRILRWLWVLQGIVTIPKMVMCAFLIFVLFFALFVIWKGSLILVMILSAIDIGIAIGIITIVVGQFTAKEADAWTVFRKEIKKALLATWLWLGSIITIFTNPSAIFAARYKTASSDPTEEQARKIARKIIIGWFVYVVLVFLTFYIALWLAYKDWRTERDGEKPSDIELENGDEHRARLISRASIDSHGDRVEPDEPSYGRK